MAGTKNDAHHHDVHDSPHGFLVCVPLGASPRAKCLVGWGVGKGHTAWRLPSAGAGNLLRAVWGLQVVMRRLSITITTMLQGCPDVSV